MWAKQGVSSYILLIVLVIFIRYVVNSETDDILNPVVRTDFGTIKGLRADDGDYAMYLGIPFAGINMSNPFGVATPHPGFEDTFEAYDDSIVCPQREEYNMTVVGSLDCLNLNIFVPNTASSDNRLPVLAYLYGGAFLNGFYNRYLYEPKFLIKHDIIIVSINYRGGPYGFMCLDTPEVPGNQGIRDQIIALRWIKRHIGAFGGDENKVTIGGHSAGSISINLHMQSDTEKLFDQAIAQSGTAVIPIYKEPIKAAPLILADYLGFQTKSIDDAIRFLAKVDTHLVITAAEDLGIIQDFKPCLEKKFDGVESTLTKDWHTTGTPKVKDMPLLLGITNDEQCGYHPSEKDEDYINIYKQIMSMCFDVSNDSEGMFDIIHNFYFGDEPISAAVRQAVVDFDSDIHFLYPVYKTIERYLEHKAGNIFLHVFSYLGKRSFVQHLWNTTKCLKAQHGDDIGYVFDISYMKQMEVPDIDQKMIDRMSTIWTNFVKFGNPLPQKSDLLPVEWPPITKSSEIPYLDINAEVTVRSRPFHQRAAFWKLFYRANKHRHISYPIVEGKSTPDTREEFFKAKEEL